MSGDALEQLHDACAEGDLRAVADAVASHPDPRGACAEVDEDGQSALHHACAGGDVSVTSFVLERVSLGSVNARDMHDMSPFHLACENGHLAVVRLLAARPDLDRNARSTRRTSYFLAAKHGFEEVCAFLEALARAEDHVGAVADVRVLRRELGQRRGLAPRYPWPAVRARISLP